MKFLVAFVMVVAVSFVQAQTSDQAEKLKKYHADCAKEVTVDQELVTKARNGDFTDNQALKDYLFCIAKKSEFINEKGELQKDVLLKKTTIAAGEELATKVVEACAVQQKDGPETTFYVLKCYREKSAPKVISLF